MSEVQAVAWDTLLLKNKLTVYPLTYYTRRPQVEVLGLTGLVRFDTTGVRSHFSLDVVTLLDEGLVPLGRWTPEGFSASGADNRTRVVPSIKNQNLTVTTLLVRN
ncbi:Glutamate receptor ionotropic, kainate 2 [Amphibalanus amphitrite]|uniref:Glutamate receptor ionotropic, kainate 2 n=1 Tax=Amphibalanus amphitrite TaxID=1232801 RepID=A0A6A4UZM7_AMPAM|nr:Glutamate receptor ionotropic, kainate 2 [Amphibalanus amphitrite]